MLAIPPIREVRDQVGPWGEVGQTRTIVLADGGTMRETLTSVERPHRFGYAIGDVRGPMRPLVERVEGRWTFEPAGTGTRITWPWDVTPTAAGTAGDAGASRGCGAATPGRPSRRSSRSLLR